MTEIPNKAELYDHMKEVAAAAGFDSLTEAITVAAKARSDPPRPPAGRTKEALFQLERAASEVARYGAQTGPQWTRLSSALIQARAALSSATPERQSKPAGTAVSERERKLEEALRGVIDLLNGHREGDNCCCGQCDRSPEDQDDVCRINNALRLARAALAPAGGEHERCS